MNSIQQQEQAQEQAFSDFGVSLQVKPKIRSNSDVMSSSVPLKKYGPKSGILTRIFCCIKNRKKSLYASHDKPRLITRIKPQNKVEHGRTSRYFSAQLNLFSTLPFGHNRCDFFLEGRDILDMSVLPDVPSGFDPGWMINDRHHRHHFWGDLGPAINPGYSGGLDVWKTYAHS